jgi:hypothetical protein
MIKPSPDVKSRTLLKQITKKNIKNTQNYKFGPDFVAA